MRRRRIVLAHVVRLAAPLAVLASPAPARAQESVRVHVDGPSDARVEQVGAGGWVTVCVAPCDKDLPTAHPARVAGSSLRDSAPFMLQGANGARDDLTVRGASKAAFTTGVVLTGVGGSLYAVGTTLLVVALVAAVGDLDIDKGAVAIAGGAMALAGGGLAGAGLGLFAINKRTQVRQDLVGACAAPGIPLPGGGSWTRVGTTERAALPKALAIPVLSVAF